VLTELRHGAHEAGRQIDGDLPVLGANHGRSSIAQLHPQQALIVASVLDEKNAPAVVLLPQGVARDQRRLTPFSRRGTQRQEDAGAQFGAFDGFVEIGGNAQFPAPGRVAWLARV